ncbi:MAG: anaerobic ribonucleoside-triphosphate reductase activating protein [Candidatus Jordarchaeaceae archaeon]
MKAYVYGILDMSTIDYPQKPAMVIFMAGCQFRCPMCHNWRMIEATPDREVELSRVFERIEKASSFIEAVKVSGGEPTLYPDVLMEIANFCKKKGLYFGFDTNGFLPENVKKLVNKTDLVSIDVKAPFNNPELYSKIAGVGGGEKIIENLVKTIKIVFESDSYADLRTVVIPTLNAEEIHFENIGNVLRTLGYPSKAEKKEASYTLQQFEPANAFNNEFKKISTPKVELLLKLAKKVNIPRVYIRHKNIGFMKPIEEIQINQ